MKRIKASLLSKENKQIFVVYKIYCKSNSKSYIGITDNFKRRFAVHWNDAKKNNTVLCRTIRKYGRDNFIILKIDFAGSWEEACKKEIEYIKKLNTQVPNGMNMTNGGDGVNGLVHSEKTKRKMKESHLGKGIGKDNSMYGKPGPNIGKKWTPEQRKKLSESCKGRIPWNKGKKCPQLSGENNGFYKGIHSKETLKIISKVNKGVPWSKETRKKTLEARKGCQVGIKHSQCKLNESDVIEIRHLYDNKELNQFQLGEKFNLTQSNIHCIVKRKSWKHI